MLKHSHAAGRAIVARSGRSRECTACSVGLTQGPSRWLDLVSDRQAAVWEGSPVDEVAGERSITCVQVAKSLMCRGRQTSARLP